MAWIPGTSLSWDGTPFDHAVKAADADPVMPPHGVTDEKVLQKPQRRSAIHVVPPPPPQNQDEDWCNAPTPLDFDPLTSVLPSARRSSYDSMESRASPPLTLKDLNVGRWATSVVNMGSRTDLGQAAAATSMNHGADSMGKRSHSLESARTAITSAANAVPSPRLWRRTNSALPQVRSTSRLSVLSTFSVAPCAHISVQQFAAEQKRNQNQCDAVRGILAHSHHGANLSEPGVYQLVTDNSCIVWSSSQNLPRFLMALRSAVALWTSFQAPYTLAFDDNPQSCGGWSSWVADVIYLVYTCSQLLTSYVDSGAYEIASLSLVLRKRLRSPSWYADLISCVPGCFPGLLLLKLLVRLRRVLFVRHDCVAILTELPLCFRSSFFGGTLRFTFFRLLLSVYLFAHLLGCLFHAAVMQHSSNVGNEERSDFFVDGAYVQALRISMNLMFSGYFGAVEDQGPEGSTTAWRAVLFYVAVTPLVMVFITTVSAEVILLAQRACVLESQQFERLAMVDEAIRSLNLPTNLSKKILAYNLWLTRNFNICAYECLLKNTSRAAQIEVKLHLCAPFISTAPFLQEAPSNFICELLESTTILAVCAGDIIFHIGDAGLGMYFIIRGGCEVLDSRGRQLSELCQGTYFGEIALISGSTRLATVVATSFMLMAFFDRRSFQGLIAQHPEMLSSIVGHCSQYTENLLTQQFIDRLGFFNDSPHREAIIERLTHRLMQRGIPPGQTVFEQGAIGESMFFVLHGTLDVFREPGGRVAELIDGAHFGELCLLLGHESRTATVKARTACLVAELHRSDFEQVMQDFPDDVLRLLVKAAKMQKTNRASEAKLRRLSVALETSSSPSLPSSRSMQSSKGRGSYDLGLSTRSQDAKSSSFFGHQVTQSVREGMEHEDDEDAFAEAVDKLGVPPLPHRKGYSSTAALEHSVVKSAGLLVGEIKLQLWADLRALVRSECEQACESSVQQCLAAWRSITPGPEAGAGG